ncbi:MAG: hypothetical protein WC604_03835 [Candidatus Gracilibacteria bacterium]
MQTSCKNCAKPFEIYQEDLNFLKKLGGETQIPPPQNCPSCRLARRMAFRNERNLYRRKCDVTGQDIISIYSPESPHKVCEKTHWYSDEFDPMKYGRDFDFNKPFFEQFHELLLDIPLPSLRVENSENCEFNSDMSDSKDCYLCARTHKCQEVLYTYRGNKSSNCVDCMQVSENSELLYECIECITCYDSQYLEFCERCSNSAFLSHCRGCTNCFLCTDLDKGQYCFLNKRLAKSEYEKRLAEFNPGSHKTREQAMKAFEKLKSARPKDGPSILKSEDCTGTNIFNSKNCFQCFDVKNVHDGRYVFNVMDAKDTMDQYTGGRNSELIYECTSSSAAYNAKFCMRVSYSRDVEYSFFTKNSQNIFGCVGMRQKKICILNKQYEQSEYEPLRKRIIEHMKKTGEYGEYFPISLSPFAYNETIAYEYFPTTKEEALHKGWRWKEKDPKEYLPQKFKVPDTIAEIDTKILGEILACEDCGKNYRITPPELKFYKNQNIPVPKKCPDRRHARRFSCTHPAYDQSK